MARILPYVEQEALWQQTEDAYHVVDYSWKTPPHPDSTAVKLFACPADRHAQEPATVTFLNPNTSSALPGVVTLEVAFTSYLGNAGTNLFSHDGAFASDAQVRLTDFIDGTSTTLLVGERPPSATYTHGWWYAGPGQQLTGSADVVLGAAELNVTRPECPPGPYAFGPGTSENPCDMFHYWSLHRHGGNFLLADGAVRFVPYSIAPTLMTALATRGGGEVASLE
jgi:hypothetical protein